jgi:RAT1-interacting protein
MSKRKISDLLNADNSPPPSPRPHAKPRLSPPPPAQTLPYPALNAGRPPKPTAFQQPLPLLTFSYTPNRTFEFTDSAMRYFVDPPLGADLGYGYERWVKRPESRGRLDGLLKGWSKAGGGKGAASRVGVVSWRGVMTKYICSLLSWPKC